MRALEVAGPNRSGESVSSCIGQFKGLGLGIKGHDRYDGAKNLFLVGPAVHGKSGDDRGRDVVPVGGAGKGHPMASALYATALLLGKFDVAHDFVSVRGRDHCANLGIGILGQAHPKRGNALRKFRHEAVVDRTLHEDARAAKANLTLVRERREQGAAEHGFEVAVCKNHVGIFTAQFKTELFEAWCRQSIDARAGGGSARERD